MDSSTQIQQANSANSPDIKIFGITCMSTMIEETGSHIEICWPVAATTKTRSGQGKSTMTEED